MTPVTDSLATPETLSPERKQWLRAYYSEKIGRILAGDMDRPMGDWLERNPEPDSGEVSDNA